MIPVSARRIFSTALVTVGLAACGTLPAAAPTAPPAPVATQAVATAAAPSTATVAQPVHAIKAAFTLADLPLASFQNGTLPGTIANDRGILLGGVGSDLWHGPNDPANEFWMVTDRGPNGEITVDGGKRRTFWVPEYTPHILKVRAEGTALNIVQALPIVGASGKPVSGLPNLEKRDEMPYDYAGQTKLTFNVNGLDPEGLVRTRDGRFWLADEYGPSLVSVDATGMVLKRYMPEGVTLDGADYPVVSSLPAIYAKRKQNRGFEGMTISADEKTIYLVLQSALLNPDKAVGDTSRQTRILAFDIASEKPVAEYVYQFDVAGDFDPKAANKPDEMKLSGLLAPNPTTIVVLERTDNIAKLYQVDLSKAVNVLGSQWDNPATSPSLEAIPEPAAAGAPPLAKRLLVDLNKLPGMPGKIEGVALIDRQTIAVANDNDFDIGKPDAAGKNVGANAKCQLLIVSLAQPLP